MKRLTRRPFRKNRLPLSTAATPRFKQRRLGLETLEDRRLLAVLYVDNTPGMAGTEFTATGGTQPASVAALTPGVDIFSTISAAVAAASNDDVINVADGTYVENIVLNKRLTLQGNQFGVDARTRGALIETVIQQAAPGITLDLNTGVAGSIIDGFEFDGGTRAIESNTGSIDNLQILNNRIVGFTNAGVFLDDTGIDVTAHQNVIDGTSKVGGGGLFHLDTDNFDGFHLTDNWILNGATATGFFVDGNHNVGASAMRAPQISGNLIQDNNTGMNLGSRAFEFGVISENTFNSNNFDGLQGGIQNSSITRNTFSNNGRSGLALTSFGNMAADRGGQNNQITENFFSGNVMEDVFLSSTQAPGTISTNRIFNNSLNSATAMTYAGGETIQASANWWGSATGPTVATNPGGAGGVIGGAGATNVDFSPWLHSGTDSMLGTPGFQGDFSVLVVEDTSPHSNLMSAAATIIQEAIALVNVGGTVYVDEGTYLEEVLVNKTVALLGAQAGVDARTRGIVPESIVDGVGSSFNISANDAIIDGFTLQGQTAAFPGAAIWMQPTTNGTEVRNNIIQNNVVGIFVANTSAINPVVIERNLFRDNTNPGAASGHGIYADEFTSGVGAQNILIDNNDFTNAALTVNSWALGISNTNVTPFTNITFSNNNVTNHGRGVYFFNTDGATISDNTIDGTSNYAIGLFTAFGGDNNANFDILNNTLTGNQRGLWVDGYTGDLDVEGNSITGGNIGLQIEDASGFATLNLTDNTITGNTTGGVIDNVSQINLTTNNTPQTVTVSGSQFSTSTVQTVGYTNVSFFDVFALDGDDTINVSPPTVAEGVDLNIHGGNPVLPASPGDTLTFTTPAGETATLVPGVPGAGTIQTTGGYLDVDFDSIETLNFAGNIAVDGTGDDDQLVVTATGSDSGTYQLIQDYSGENGGPFAGPIVAFAGATSFAFNGLGGDDQFIINNPGGGLFLALPGGIAYDGGVGGEDDNGDELHLLGGSAASVEHRLIDNTSGSVRYNGSATDNVVYSNLAPILDTIAAGTRTFTFLGGAETITLSDDGDLGDGESRIDSTLGEVITFAHPATLLTIVTDSAVTGGAAGADALQVEGLDSLYSVDLTINGDADDTVTFQTNDTDLGAGNLLADAASFAFNASLTTTSNVDLTALTDGVTDNADDNVSNLTADEITLILTTAGNTIGASAADRLELDANILQVSAGLGNSAFLRDTAGGVILRDSSVGAAANVFDLVAESGSITGETIDGVRDIGAGILILETTGAGTIGTSAASRLEINAVTRVDATTAGGDIFLVDVIGGLPAGAINAGGGANDVDLLVTGAGNGISDANGAALNVTANDLIASAPGAIDLDTNVDTVDAESTGSGSILLDELDGVTLLSVTTVDGDVLVNAGGTATAVLVTAQGAGRDAKITTSAGDIEVGTVEAPDFVRLDAAGAIIDLDATDPDVTAVNLILTSGSGVASSGDPLEISVSSVAATGGAGGVFLSNDQDLTIDALTYMGLVTGVSGGGDAAITADGALTVAADVTLTGNVDLAALDSPGAGQDLTVNTLVTVSSGAGNVTLAAGDDLTLIDSSTVSALLGVVNLWGDAGDADPGLGSAIGVFGTVDSGSAAQVLGAADNDTITIDPGVGHTVSASLLDGQGGDDEYTIQYGRLTGAQQIADSGGGTDRATVIGLPGDESYVVHNHVANGVNPQTGGVATNVTEGETVDYSATLEFLTVRGEAGNDTFDVQPSQTAEITIHGGAPSFGPGPNDVPAQVGDTLDFDPFNNIFQVVGKTLVTSGGNPNAFKGVNFISIENLPLDPIGTTTQFFDFDGPALETQAGYTSVAPGRLYGTGTPGSDYGWVGAIPSSFDRGAALTSATLQDLLQDGHFSPNALTFRADVSNGWHLISLKSGDLHQHDQIRVRNVDTGQILLDNVANVAGQFNALSFVVQVTDGTLDLEISDQGGEPVWVLNGLEIRPGAILTFGSPEPAPLSADGFSEDVFFGYNATPGALVTVMAGLDTSGDNLPDADLMVVSPDAAPELAGVQVLADGAGVFSYTIRRPSIAGMAFVKLEETSGAQTGCVAIEYVAGMTRRFDFNRPGAPPSPTQPPVATALDPTGYIGVLPSDQFGPGMGYGWTGTVSSLDRGNLPGAQAQEELRRDFHLGFQGPAGARVFRTELAPGMYAVNVTLGDALAAHDDMQVRANGNVAVTNVDTPAGQFFHRIFLATVGGSGLLDLELSDLGGDPNWVFNGVEIRPAGAVYGQLQFTTALGNVPGDSLAPPDVIMGTAPASLNGSYVTVTTTAGTIVSDDNPQYAGAQALVVGGVFQFSVQRPAVGSTTTPTFTAQAIDGSAEGSSNTVVTYTSQGLRFDLNRAGSPTAPGFIGVAPPATYDPMLGYGWQNAISTANRGGPTALLQDLHFGTDNTFLVDLANGDYVVNVTLGDAASPRDLVDLYAEGVLQAGDVTTALGQFAHRSFMVTVNDGQLTLRVDDSGGEPFFAVNAIEVYPVTNPADFMHLLTPNGTGTVVNGTGATPGSLVTVATSLGSVASPDADPNYAGVQVVADGAGAFSFLITPPASSGMATITSEEVTGLGKGTTNFNYVVSAPARRFDFNGTGSPTQAGFTGVRGTETYTAAKGYGWKTSVWGFNKGTTFAPTSKELYRDGAFGYYDVKGAQYRGVFQVSAAPGVAYDIRVYVGDPDSPRDNIRVTAEDGTFVNVPNTGAGMFTSVVLLGEMDANNDGILEITISDVGPQNSDLFWVANGLDVAEAMTGLPPAAPLLAGFSGGGVGSSLTSSELAPIVAEAISLWEGQDLSAFQRERLHGAEFQIQDLSHEGALGLAGSRLVLIDDDGAGHGWRTALNSSSSRTSSSPASMDLLSVVLHELGHVVGLSDLDPRYEPHHLMAGYLQPGQQRSLATSALRSPAARSQSIATDLAFANFGDVMGDLLSRGLDPMPLEQRAGTLSEEESVLSTRIASFDSPATLVADETLALVLEGRSRRKRWEHRIDDNTDSTDQTDNDTLDSASQ